MVGRFKQRSHSVVSEQGPVARSLVSANCWLRSIETYRFPWYLTLISANCWLRSIETYRFPWYLTLVSANQASSNLGQEDSETNKHVSETTSVVSELDGSETT